MVNLIRWHTLFPPFDCCVLQLRSSRLQLPGNCHYFGTVIYTSKAAANPLRAFLTLSHFCPASISLSSGSSSGSSIAIFQFIHQGPKLIARENSRFSVVFSISFHFFFVLSALAIKSAATLLIWQLGRNVLHWKCF